MIELFLGILVLYLFVSLYFDYKKNKLEQEYEKLRQENQNKRLEKILNSYKEFLKEKK